MYFDGASSKLGLGASVVLISLEKNTFTYSFTVNFTCTNNIEEYEALLFGLRVAMSHGIRKMHVIVDFELVVSQIN